MSTTNLLFSQLLFQALHLLLFILFIIFLYKWLYIKNHITNKNLPPSPSKLPIIGNLHQLDKFPHRSLWSLSERYGKLMLLHLGSKPTLVVSSAQFAQETMVTQDLTFANRPNLRFINRIFYGGKDIAFARYGQEWRCLKSIAVIQLLTTNKVRSFRKLREEEVALLVDKIKCSGFLSPVNLSEMFLRYVIDSVNRTVLGRKFCDEDDEGINFNKLFRELTEVMGTISVGDFIPWLGWIDRASGLEGRAGKIKQGFDVFFEKVIKEHVDRLERRRFMDDKEAKEGESIHDFLDTLLQIRREDPFHLSTAAMNGLILDMFIGATETSYTVLGWTMAEVLKHPRVMKELQQEVRGIVNGKKGVTEDDLKNMKYLKAVIKETLRLHPPSPLLAFRESIKDTKIGGYDIAAGTMVIINAWAIQRDPACWEEPEKFIPERFLDSTVDFRGHHFQFIPFGAGRRGCPGTSYGMATIELAIANLLYEFDWKLPGGAPMETLDMTEAAGITIHLRIPLKVIATPRR